MPLKSILCSVILALMLPYTGFAGIKSQDLQKVAAEIKTLCGKDAFSGVVLVEEADKIVLEDACGLANRAYRVPNRVDTRFNIGSINKEFTRIAILQLAEREKLHLDDVIATLWPDYPNPGVAANVTVRQLLEMRSGIPDFFGPKYQAIPKNKLRSNMDYLQLFVQEPLLFEPGTSRKYSNGGYVVLGGIVEKVTGQSYYDYVRANILEPAGMKETGFFAPDEIVQDVATGYTRSEEDGQLRSNLYTLPGRCSAAGGAYSTAHDLLKFTRAQQDGLFFKSGRKAAGGGHMVAGGAPGLNAAVDVEPAATVIVLSNQDPPAAEDLADRIFGLLGIDRPKD